MLLDPSGGSTPHLDPLWAPLKHSPQKLVNALHTDIFAGLSRPKTFDTILLLLRTAGDQSVSSLSLLLTFLVELHIDPSSYTKPSLHTYPGCLQWSLCTAGFRCRLSTRDTNLHTHIY